MNKKWKQNSSRYFISQKGVSLVELIVTITIFSIVCGGMYAVLASGRSAWRIVDIQVQLRDSLHLVLERASKEIREAGSPGTGLDITQGATDSDPDTVKFSIPVMCESGTDIVDSSGKVNYWRAPLTWGCQSSTCMDADNDCDTDDYSSITYSVDSVISFYGKFMMITERLFGQMSSRGILLIFR